MAWIDITEYKALTGIEKTDDEITAALEFASEQVKNYLFVKKTYQTSNINIKHLLPFYNNNFIADWNEDSTLLPSDISVIEFDPNNDYDETDLLPFLSTIKKKPYIDSLLLTFSEAKPTDGQTMYIEYHIQKYSQSRMEPIFKELTMLFATEWLISKTPAKQMQDGIGSWNLNEVSISIDASTVESILESISKRKAQLIIDYQPSMNENQKPGYNKQMRTRFSTSPNGSTPYY